MAMPARHSYLQGQHALQRWATIQTDVADRRDACLVGFAGSVQGTGVETGQLADL